MKRDKNLVRHRKNAEGLDLKGLNAAIVGGTGDIGRALSRLLASRGANVTGQPGTTQSHTRTM